MEPNQVFYEESSRANRGGQFGESFSGFPIGFAQGCVWIDGVHAYCENPECPEVKNTDEMGDHIPVGWTVQQADRYASLSSELAKKGNNNAS